MKWSWKIGSYKGIGVYIHATFLLLIAWIAYSHWSQSKDLTEVLTGIGFVLVLFGCVLLHEFGHSLTAQKLGIQTRDITLLPIGGVARLERMPDDPKQELWVAIAGPAVNVTIALILYLWLQITATFQPFSTLTITTGPFYERLMVVNLILVAFNMIPAFPMDGGRVLRAALAMKMDYARATQIAATFGQGIAFLFGFFGFFYNPFLIFIAFFVWIGASQEASMTQMRSSFHGIPVDYAMMTDFRTLDANDTLAEAVKQILAGSQQDFPVMEDKHVIGILTRNDITEGLAREGEHFPVAKAMQANFEVAYVGEMLYTAFHRLKGCKCHSMPVLKDDRPVGLLTMENVGEFMMIHSALKKSTAKISM